MRTCEEIEAKFYLCRLVVDDVNGTYSVRLANLANVQRSESTNQSSAASLSAVAPHHQSQLKQAPVTELTTSTPPKRTSQHDDHRIVRDKMTKFRPCIDLHAGQVKQIVGGTLDSTSAALQTNYVSQHPAAYYAQLYKDNALEGSHVIMLGPGNEESARQALQAWPGHLQVGGGINDKNAKEWMEAGASKVSWRRLVWS